MRPRGFHLHVRATPHAPAWQMADVGRAAGLRVLPRRARDAVARWH